MTKNKGEKKQNRTIGLFGNVDAGKSTLAGQLMFKCGLIDRRVFARLEQTAIEMGQTRFKYAFILQLLSRESPSKDILTFQFETESKLLTIMDLVGYRNYAQSVTTSCSRVDCALFVIPASVGEFEASLSKISASREQMRIAQTFGVEQLIVAVNKMDLTEPSPYSEERFNEIKTELSICLKKMNYQPTHLIFIPISADHGENLLERSTKMSWFQGQSFDQHTCHTLFDALDSLNN